MLITSITKQKGDRYVLYVDGENYATVDGVVLLTHRLKVGSEVAESVLLQLKEESGANFAFLDAVKYLSRSRHTESEVRGKLSSKGYGDKEIDVAIKKLIEYGYVDDEAYAKAYVLTYGATRGKNRLRYEMSLKGVKKEYIDEALPEDEYLSAYKLAEKKRSRYSDREKLIRYLIGRGYDWEVSRRVVEQLEGDDETF